MRFKNKIVILCVLVNLLLLNGCKNTEDIGMVVDGYTVKGTIKIRLFDKIAPKTVAAIKELVSHRFFLFYC